MFKKIVGVIEILCSLFMLYLIPLVNINVKNTGVVGSLTTPNIISILMTPVSMLIIVLAILFILQGIVNLNSKK